MLGYKLKSKDAMTETLRKVRSAISSPVEERLFAEYGAVFVTTATPPPSIIFKDSSEVEAFQSALSIRRELVGDYEIALQSEAMSALIGAAAEMKESGGQITARSEDSGGRSYQDTVSLWLRNVTRGLERWENLGAVTPERAQQIRALAPVEQVSVILGMEDEEQIFFGTFFDRSILYSVAAPGASQHLSLLAFDAAEYKDEEVERTLNNWGWYRTVPNDLPHFTYLGHPQPALPELGLRLTEREYDQRKYGFWVPDFDVLR